MTISVDDVCTDTDLETEVGGPGELSELIPNHWNGSAETARRETLNDVLAELAARRPPVYESNIAVAAELKRPVAYGSLVRLYRFAMTAPDDRFAAHHKEFSKKYASALSNLNPTTAAGETAAPLGIAFHRR